VLSLAARVRMESPRGRDRPCAESVAERQGLAAGVEHNARHKLITDAAGEPLDTAEVLGSHGLGCFHLARDHFA